jgi:hypothetical protein
MQMIDVLNKLREIQGRSPEELGRAISSVAKLNDTIPEKKVVETKSTNMPDTSNGSYMVDVLSKLREIESRNPGEVNHAIDSLTKLNQLSTPVKEAIEIKTSGDDAVLAQILKLAGMVGGVNSPDMAGQQGDITSMGDMGSHMPEIPHDHAMVPSVGGIDGDMEIVADIEKDMSGDNDYNNDMPSIGGPGVSISDKVPTDDDRPVSMKMSGAKEAAEGESNRPYTNSPHEITRSLKSSIPSGNDLGKPKATYPKVAGGDNPTHVAVSFD